MAKKKYKYVNDLWKDSEVKKLDPANRLIYRSNKLGSDQRITNTGGGNTSSKLMETDPLTGEKVEVLWVKGSGGDLRTSKKENFASLYQEKLIALQSVYAKKKKRGPKTPAEDEMVGMYPHCTLTSTRARPPSTRRCTRLCPANTWITRTQMRPSPFVPPRIPKRSPKKCTATTLSGRRGCVRASSSASPCRRSPPRIRRPRA